MRELAKDVERERALKDAAEATSKERAKIATTTEKKAVVGQSIGEEEACRFGS